MLDVEAEQLCNAARYERTEARKDCRAHPQTGYPTSVSSKQPAARSS